MTTAFSTVRTEGIEAGRWKIDVERPEWEGPSERNCDILWRDVVSLWQLWRRNSCVYGQSGFRRQSKYVDLAHYPHSPLAKTDWKSQEPSNVVPMGQPLRAQSRVQGVHGRYSACSLVGNFLVYFSNSISCMALYQDNMVVTVGICTGFESRFCQALVVGQVTQTFCVVVFSTVKWE